MCNIRFTVDKPSHVTIKIVNVIGVEICTLLDENEPAGQHEINCDDTRFGPGSFYYKIYVDEPAYPNQNTNGKHNGKILKETKPLAISQNGSGKP
jgi:hypothetical protein